MQVININTLYNYVAYLAGKDIAGGFLPPDRWNDMVPILVNKIVRKYFGLPEEYQPGMPMPRIGYEITQVVTDYISQLKKEITFVVPPSGKVTKPDDYLHKSSMVVSGYSSSTSENEDAKTAECCDDETMQAPKSKRKKTTVTKQWYPVTFVSENERWSWLNSSLRKPTLENPIATFLGNDEIQIYPENVKSALFTYIRYPATAKWNYTVVKGIPVYQPVGSTDVELPEICADELAVTILDRIGITIREPGVTEYARYIKNSGK